MAKLSIYHKTYLLFFMIAVFSHCAYSDYASLKSSRVNVRWGPGFIYPIKYIYIKKYLPVYILQEFDGWLLIKDTYNQSGWVKKDLVGKKKSAITTSIIFGYKVPDANSKPIIKIDESVIVLIKRCQENFCSIKIDKYKAWVEKSSLWGI